MLITLAEIGQCVFVTLFLDDLWIDSAGWVIANITWPCSQGCILAMLLTCRHGPMRRAGAFVLAILGISIGFSTRHWWGHHNLDLLLFYIRMTICPGVASFAITYGGLLIVTTALGGKCVDSRYVPKSVSRPQVSCRGVFGLLTYQLVVTGATMQADRWMGDEFLWVLIFLVPATCSCYSVNGAVFLCRGIHVTHAIILFSWTVAVPTVLLIASGASGPSRLAAAEVLGWHVCHALGVFAMLRMGGVSLVWTREDVKVSHPV